MPYLSEPFSHRLVVDLQAEPCQRNAANYYQQRHVPCLLQSVLFGLDEPAVEGVHQWVVDDVEWVGDVAQKAADACRSGIGGLARCCEPHHTREDCDDAYAFEHAIQTKRAKDAAERIATIYIRHVKECE